MVSFAGGNSGNSQHPQYGLYRTVAHNLYDSFGRVYESDVYEVDQQDAANPGTVGDRLPTYYWYDAASRLIKTATGNGLFQKYAYDGLGRTVVSYTCYDTDETAYADADDVTGDTVIEQSQTVVRPSRRNGRLGHLSAPARRHHHDRRAYGGQQLRHGRGRLVRRAGPHCCHGQLRPRGRGFRADALLLQRFDRRADRHQHQRHPGRGRSRPACADSSDNYIVALTQYNDAGRAYRSIDNLGRINETQYDDAGRVVKTIQNYANGTVDGNRHPTGRDRRLRV